MQLVDPHLASTKADRYGSILPADFGFVHNECEYDLCLQMRIMVWEVFCSLDTILLLAPGMCYAPDVCTSA